MEITGKTGMFALFGTPVVHSGSPAMYNFCFGLQGLDYVYLGIDVGVDGMKEALSAMRLFNMRGANVTMPCKNIAAELVDVVTPAAQIVGSVNTIVNEDGKLVGYVTDGVGFVRSLKEEGVDVAGKKLVVLGAGGAGTALQVQCALDGARELSIFNVKDEFFTRAQGTAEKLAKEAPDCKVSVYDLADRAKLAEEIASADILVNSTNVGMNPLGDQSLVDIEMMRPDLIVTDTIYHSPEKTKLLYDAESLGCKIILGKGMMVWQGAVNYKLFTGLEMPVAKYQEYQLQAAK